MPLKKVHKKLQKIAKCSYDIYKPAHKILMKFSKFLSYCVNSDGTCDEGCFEKTAFTQEKNL